MSGVVRDSVYIQLSSISVYAFKFKSRRFSCLAITSPSIISRREIEEKGVVEDGDKK